MSGRPKAAIAVLLAAALALGLVGPSAVAVPAVPAGERAEAQRLLHDLRRHHSAPGAGITYGDGEHDVTLSSGTGRVLADDPIRSTDKVRVGSDTKMFVAAVALQLAAEGRLDLDVPVERYLPGVLRYPTEKVPGDPHAFDGRTVTLRQLLQHTAGVADYADLVYVLHPLHQVLVPTPRQLVDYALRKGPTGRPGDGWRYSNTHYALVGMVLEATTGRSLSTEIAERIAEPLELRNTFFPRPGQRSLPGGHVRGYLTSLVPLDVTNLEPAIWGAAGGLVSSPDDMNTFISALLAGEVVPPELLSEMQDDVPAGTGGYGLGLVRVPLSCGDAWGHGGFVAGYQTLGLGLSNGRHAFFTANSSITLNLLPPPRPATTDELFELVLC